MYSDASNNHYLIHPAAVPSHQVVKPRTTWLTLSEGFQK